MIKIRGVGKPLRLITKALGGRRICAICDARVAAWIPHSLVLLQPPLLKHLAVVGSDLKNYACPICGSFDRERHLALYFRATDFFEKHVSGKDILHFAAETHLASLILANRPRRYVKANLHPEASDVERIDMQAIPYGDQTFDLVLANHVLEHVADDHLGLAEIHRILRVGGVAVLQTPFSSKLRATLDDPGIDTDYLRTQLFGQADHLRLYGRDIVERITSHGFVAVNQRHEEALGAFDAAKFGVPSAEPFMLFQKAFG